MPTEASINLAQQMFVAYYGRPGDPAGVAYWAGKFDETTNLDEALAAFGDSAEFTANFGGLSNEALVTGLFQQMFNRDPDAAGLAFYVGRLDSGEATLASIAKQIADGAQGDDATTLANKVAVAQHYTDYVAQEDAIYEAGDIPAAAAILADVDYTADSVVLGNAAAEAAIDGKTSQQMFTLFETWTEGTAGTEDVTAVYWGYNPNGNVDGTSTGDDEEGPSDGGVPVEEMLDFLTAITGQDLTELGLVDDDGQGPFDNVTNLQIGDIFNGDGAGDLTINFADGTSKNAEVELGEAYFDFLNNLLFDSEGNSRLYEEVIDEGTSGTSGGYSLQRITLTPSENSGGTLEEGVTSGVDNMIVAGRTELLHQAYIDGGEGDNALEVDMKGVFAQPLAIKNIQTIHVSNMPNVYTDQEDGSSDYPDYWEEPAGFVGPNAYQDSFLDLSRAIDLETLVVTEGVDFLSSDVSVGDLTIAGIRNGAPITLEGGFTSGTTLNLHYGQGLGDMVYLNLNLGETDGVTFNVAHNSNSISLNSTGGGNYIQEGDLGGSLSNIYVSGDAVLHIDSDLASSIASGHPLLIDARENTAGVDLVLSSHDDEVTFHGTNADDHFETSGGRNIWAWGYEGNNEFDLEGNDDIVVVVGDGNNEIEAFSNESGNLGKEDNVTVTAGDGRNDINVGADYHTTVTAGDGNNEIMAYAGDEGDDLELRVTVGDGSNEIDVTGGYNSWVTAGDGDNIIRIDDNDYDVVNNWITTGNGNNVIEANASSLEAVYITTGEGNDSIEAQLDVEDVISITSAGGDNDIWVEGGTITVATGSGDDTVTVLGAGVQDSSGSDETDNPLAPGDSVLLNLNLGAGNNTVVLGDDNDGTDGTGITATIGSVISGENISLYIGDDTNLVRAITSGIESVYVAHTDSLVVRPDQFLAIGAENFNVPFWDFAGTAVVTIFVQSDLDAGTLGLENLPTGMKVQFVLSGGAELTITAEDLDAYVINTTHPAAAAVVGGIVGVGTTLGTPDGLDGSVVITNAGQTFDETTPGAADGGAILPGAALAIPVEIEREVDGFERETVAPDGDVLVIDSNETPVVEDDVNTTAATVWVTGDQDIAFEGVVNLGEGGVFDFSSLNGMITDITITDFSDINGADNTTLSAEDEGAIIGNGTDTRINVELDGDIGFDDGFQGGLVSSGVATYVVTDTDGNYDFWVCDKTQGLEYLGLQMQSGFTISFHDVNWGVGLLLEGDGDVEHSLKENGNPNYSNIGAVEFNYFFDGASAEVMINNQGTALVDRALRAEGITINNADDANITVEDGDLEIALLAGDSLDDVVFTSAGSVDVFTTDLSADLPSLDSLDGSGVAGLFNYWLLGGSSTDNDFSGVDVTGLDILALFSAGATLTVDQGLEWMGGIIDLDGNSNLVFTDLAEQAVDFTAFGVADVTDVTLADQASIVFDSTTVFGNGIDAVDSLTFVTNTTSVVAEISEAQFNQLAGAAPDVNDDTTPGTDATTGLDYTSTLYITGMGASSDVDLANVSTDAVWVGLSDITATSDFTVDNGTAVALISGTVDLTGAGDISGIAAFSFAADGTLRITADQLTAMGLTDVNGDGIADQFAGNGFAANIEIVDIDGADAFDLDLIAAAGINVGNLYIENTDALVTLALASLGGADAIITPTASSTDTTPGIEDTSLSIDLDLFRELDGIGTITGGSSVTITDIGNRDDSDDADLIIDSLVIDTSGITAQSLALALSANTVLSEDSNVAGAAIDLNTFTIAFATAAQANGAIVEDGVVAWLFDDLGGLTVIDTTWYDTTISQLQITEDLEDLVVNNEDLWTFLASGTTVYIGDPDEILDNVLLNLDRTKIVEAFVGLPNGITVDDQTGFVNIQNFTLQVNGNVNIGPVIVDDTGDGDNGTFSTLTIESREIRTDADGNALGIDDTYTMAANIIGDISLAAGSVNELTDIVIDTNAVNDGDGSTDATNEGLDIEVGTITFASNGLTNTASLDLDGANSITIEAIDMSDTDITVVEVDATDMGLDGVATTGNTLTIGGINVESVFGAVDGWTILDGHTAADTEDLGGFGVDVLEVRGSSDISDANSADFDAVVFSQSGSSLDIDAADLFAILGAAPTDVDGDGAADNFIVLSGVTGVTINITNYNGEDLDLDFIENAGINIGTITVADGAGANTVTYAATGSLGGADEIIIDAQNGDTTFEIAASVFLSSDGVVISEILDGLGANVANVLVEDLDDAATTNATTGQDEITINLSNVSVSGTTTIELADAGDAADVQFLDSALLGDFSILLESQGDATTALPGQTVRFSNSQQAERDITDLDTLGAGGVLGSNVVWDFVALTGDQATNGFIDTTGYNDIGRLWMLDDLVETDATNNVEALFSELDDDIIIRIENEDFDALRDVTVAINRDIEVTSFTTMSSFEVTNDNLLEHVFNLNVILGGEVNLGDFRLDNVLAPADPNFPGFPGDDEFGTLTIQSTLANSNTHYLLPDDWDEDDNPRPDNNIYGFDGTNVIGDISLGTSGREDLSTVVLDSRDVVAGDGAHLTVGTIYFAEDTDIDPQSGLNVSDSTATITLEGSDTTYDDDGDGTPDTTEPVRIQVKSLDTTDGDITTLVIDNNMTGGGTFLLTGGSPAAAGGPNTESIQLDGVAGSATVFGMLYSPFDAASVEPFDATDGNGSYIPNVDGNGDLYAGVSGEGLREFVLTGAGDFNVGVIAQVEGAEITDPADAFGGVSFTLDASAATGIVQATMGEANVDGVLTSPTLGADGIWTIDMSGAAGGGFDGSSFFRITGDVTLGAGTLNLDIEDADLVIDGIVDMTTLDTLFLDLDAGEIVLAADTTSTGVGTVLILTDAQFDGSDFDGATYVDEDGNPAVLTITQALIDEIGNDFTDVRGYSEYIIENGLTVTLTNEQAAVSRVEDETGALGAYGDLDGDGDDATVTVEVQIDANSNDVDLTAQLDVNGNANITLTGMAALTVLDDGDANTNATVTTTVAEASSLVGNVTKNGNLLNGEAGFTDDGNGNDTNALQDLTDPDGDPNTNDAYDMTELDILTLEDDDGTIINLDQWNALLDANNNVNIVEADGNGNNDLALIASGDLSPEVLDVIDDLVITADTTITAAQAEALETITQTPAYDGNVNGNAFFTLTMDDLRAYADSNPNDNNGVFNIDQNININLNHVINDSNTADAVSDGVANIVLSLDTTADANGNDVFTVDGGSDFGGANTINATGTGTMDLNDENQVVDRILTGTGNFTMDENINGNDVDVTYTGSGSLVLDGNWNANGDNTLDASGATGTVDVYLDLNNNTANGDTFTFMGSSGQNIVRIEGDSANNADNNGVNLNFAAGAGTMDTLVISDPDDANANANSTLLDNFTGFEILQLGDLNSNSNYDLTNATAFTSLLIQEDSNHDGSVSSDANWNVTGLSATMAQNITIVYDNADGNGNGMFDNLTFALDDDTGLNNQLTINFQMDGNVYDDGNISDYVDGNLTINGVELITLNSTGDATDGNANRTVNRAENLFADSLEELTITGAVDFEVDVNSNTIERVDANGFTGQDLNVNVNTLADVDFRGTAMTGDANLNIQGDGDVEVNAGSGDDNINVFVNNSQLSDDVDISSGAGNDTIVVGDDNSATDVDIETGTGADFARIDESSDLIIDLGDNNDLLITDGVSDDIDASGGNGNDLIIIDQSTTAQSSTVNIDLDGGNDTLGLYDTGYDANAPGGTTVISVNDFDAAEDSLILMGTDANYNGNVDLNWVDGDGNNVDTGYDVDDTNDNAGVQFLTVGLAATDYNLVGQVPNDETLVVEFSFDSNFDGNALDINANGNVILDNMVTDGNYNNGDITVDNGQAGYFVLYFNNDAFLVYFSDDSNDGNINTNEVMLIAVLDDVDQGDLNAGNFDNLFY